MIGISGFYKGSSNCIGKDTVADLVCSLVKGTKYSFANKPKKMLCLLTNTKMFHWNNHLFKDKVIFYNRDGNEYTGREYLIKFAEGIKQTMGEYVWIDALFDEIEQSNSNPVISDIRFFNEAQQFTQMGGTIIYLNRDNSYVKDLEQVKIVSLPNVKMVNANDRDEIKFLVTKIIKEVCEK
jgi:hypothetical protein